MKNKNGCKVHSNSPILIFVFLEELFHLFFLEFILIVAVTRNCITFVNAVVLLCQKLLETKHHVTCWALGGGVWGFSWDPVFGT